MAPGRTREQVTRVVSAALPGAVGLAVAAVNCASGTLVISAEDASLLHRVE